MIEHIPEQVENALLYFHSAGVSSEQLRPFLPDLIAGLPRTYLWAGDGVISGSPLMRQGLHYGEDARRYWFTFPMQDASSPESFARHVEAMGAALSCGGAYVNALADQIMARFRLPARRVILCGFQHGSSIALSAAMLRRKDPYALTILFEPYILEAYYLKEEANLPRTTVVCIDNEHIRARTRAWINIETDREFQSFGMVTRAITVKGGGDPLDAAMMQAAIQVVQALE
jgi:predicted esterase